MKTSPAPSTDSPPILLSCLLVGSLACGAAAVGLGAVDVPAFVTRRIVQAGGTLSPEMLAGVQPFALRGMLGWAAVLLGAAAIVVWRTRLRWRARWTREESADDRVGPPARWLDPGGFVVLSGLAVMARFYRTLPDGFFRYDDFDLLSVARGYPWWESTWMPHGDHFLPGTRWIAAAAYALFGATAWPYNLGVLMCFWAMLAAGCQLLAEWKVAPAARAGFVALVLFWSPWAEITSGYYILSSYTLIAALGLCAVWCYRRWRVSPNVCFAAGAVLCVVAATLIDISGWYAPAALAVFVAADWAATERPCEGMAWLRQHRGFLLGLGLALLTSLAVYVYAYAVVNRGTFLSMAAGGTRSIARIAAEFAYLFDAGLLVSFVVPFIYARIPPLLLALVGTAVFAVWSAFMVGAFRHADHRRRLMGIAVAVVLAGVCLMVNLGRPSEDTLRVRWAAKHVGPAYVWLCLLLVLAWDVLWIRVRGRRKIIMAELSLVFLGGFCIAQTALGHLGLAVAFPPFGYPAEIRDAIARRAAIGDLQAKLIDPVARASAGPVTIPTLDGPYIAAHTVSLFEYNLSSYEPFFGAAARRISLVRNSAMQRWHARDVTTVPELRAAVSLSFVELLGRDHVLRKLYFTSVQLRVMTRPATPADRRTPAGGAVVESDGSFALELQSLGFDPETAPLLTVLLDRDPAPAAIVNAKIPLTIMFTSDIADAQGRGTFTVPAHGENVTEVDLRQMTAFALSRNVTNVRLVFPAPGHYRVHVARLGPDQSGMRVP